jgi:hypothetical protein
MRVYFNVSVDIPGYQHALRVERDDLGMNQHGVVIPYTEANKDTGEVTQMEALVPWNNVKSLTRKKGDK